MFPILPLQSLLHDSVGSVEESRLFSLPPLVGGSQREGVSQLQIGDCGLQNDRLSSLRNPQSSIRNRLTLTLALSHQGRGKFDVSAPYSTTVVYSALPE